jgi:hypothetical protein
MVLGMLLLLFRDGVGSRRKRRDRDPAGDAGGPGLVEFTIKDFRAVARHPALGVGLIALMLFGGSAWFAQSDDVTVEITGQLKGENLSDVQVFILAGESPVDPYQNGRIARKIPLDVESLKVRIAAPSHEYPPAPRAVEVTRSGFLGSSLSVNLGEIDLGTTARPRAESKREEIVTVPFPTPTPQPRGY